MIARGIKKYSDGRGQREPVLPFSSARSVT